MIYILYCRAEWIRSGVSGVSVVSNIDSCKIAAISYANRISNLHPFIANFVCFGNLSVFAF